MTHPYERYRTLADYQEFLRHPDSMIRNWAADCIEQQYPADKVESLAPLLQDSDGHLQIMAAGAIGDSAATRYEPALRELWPATRSFVRNWFTRALGQLRSEAMLPRFVAEVEAIGTEPVGTHTEITWLFPHSVVQALGWYPDEPARTALWALLERYPAEDRLIFEIAKGLLRYIAPDEVGRLLRRWFQLKPGEQSWYRLNLAIAAEVNLDFVVDELRLTLARNVDEARDFLDYWFGQEVPFSERLLIALEQTAEAGYEGVWPQLKAEMEWIIAERGDDVAAWQAEWLTGTLPAGYRWRMVYSCQVLLDLAEQAPSQPQRNQEAVALGLALIAQMACDQDDEAALAAASNEMFRQATLLNIIGSPHPTVLPDIEAEVAALGPTVVPHLIEILTGDNEWGWLRALSALELVARQYPGAADAAAPYILDFIYEGQADHILEVCGKTVTALGPGAVEAIGERLGQDYVYDIYAGSALTNIPTPASAEIYLSYLKRQPELEEYHWEYLVDLGHPAAIPLLRDHFDWRGDPHLCTALYKLAVVTGYDGPELGRWQTVARKEYRRSEQIFQTLDAPEATPASGSSSGSQRAAKKQKEQKKQKRKAASAQKKRNRAGKKKKRRR